jgi:hypothetical protein
MTCFNTRHEARASLLVRAHALNGQRRHRNQQSYKNIWFDATSVKACMWRKECDPRPEEYEGLASYAADLTMDMYEEDYRDLPRSTKAERKAARAMDQRKCGCARTWLALGLGFGFGFGFGFGLGFGFGFGAGRVSAPHRAMQHLRGVGLRGVGSPSARAWGLHSSRWPHPRRSRRCSAEGLRLLGR